MTMASQAEEKMLDLLVRAGVPRDAIQREVRFARPEREFRADFLVERLGLIVEVDGATFAAGRHTRVQGFHQDMVKLNMAARRGYRVYRTTTHMSMMRDVARMVGEEWQAVR